jgi:hypothetical protein
MRFIRQPDGALTLGDFLRTELAGRWAEFRAAVGFVKRAGVNYIAEELAAFAATRPVRISVGVDLQGTSREGLESLLNTVTANGGEVWVYHNSHRARPTFHPKLFLLKSPDRAVVVMGSGNLTLGGLFTNYEASVAIELDPAVAADAQFLSEVEGALDAWCDPSQRLARLLSAELLVELERQQFIVPEVRAVGDEEVPAAHGPPTRTSRQGLLFGEAPVPRPPERTRRVTARGAGPLPGPPGRGRYRGFVMTLQQTDVGVGQKTAGTSRRSPELFIPLAARDEAPDFWGWRHRFNEDRSRPGKWDRSGVRMRIGVQVVEVNMMTWPVKHDFRLRSEALRSAGRVGDILRIEPAPASLGFDYYVEIVPQGTTQYGRWLAHCVTPVRNSPKRYGYY